MTNEEHNLKVFWNTVRTQYGVDKLSSYQERLFWEEARKQREFCWYSNDPEYSITEAFSYDKPAMLEKWWEHLSFEDKQKYLTHAWIGKGSALLFGYYWWIDKFKEVGFLTNTKLLESELEPVTLYRGSIPDLKQGMSWTDNIEFAKLFKDQYEGSKIYQIEAVPGDILGIIEGVAFYIDGDKIKGFEYVLYIWQLYNRITEFESSL